MTTESNKVVNHNDIQSKDYINDLSQTIKTKVDSYDPTKTGKESEFSDGEAISFGKLAFQHATGCDKILFYLACLFAML